MRFPARILFCLLLVVSSLLLVARPALAQTNEAVPQNTHNYVQTVMLDTMAALTCNLAGIDPTGPDPVTGEPKKCLGYDPLTGALSFVGQSPAPTGGGAIGAMGGLIAVLYNPPLSSGDYFQYLARNFGIAKPVYAEGKCEPGKPGFGTGFCGLKPLLPVWTVFRNLVYVLFAVAFVLVGLAIMLRVRIDPRTVMTIQNQIPKLIIALLLVTFSYAIAGFLVDVMYVVIFLLFGVFQTIPGASLGNLDPLTLQGSNPFGAVNELTGITTIASVPAGQIGQFFGPFFDNPPGKFIVGLIMGVAGRFLGNMTSDLIGGIITAIPGLGLPAATTVNQILRPVLDGVLGIGGVIAGVAFAKEIVGFVGSLIAFIIIIIAVLWALFRLWFQLIMAFVMLLIDVVFAPFWILMGVLPGAPIGFGAWLREVLSNLSPFPVTIGMFLLAKMFMESVKTFSNPFVPPLIGNPGQGQIILSSFIGLGFILLTPQVVAMTKDFLKAPVFKYYPAIGQAIGVGTSAVQAPFRPLITGMTFLGGQKWAEKLFPVLKR